MDCYTKCHFVHLHNEMLFFALDVGKQSWEKYSHRMLNGCKNESMKTLSPWNSNYGSQLPRQIYTKVSNVNIEYSHS